MSKGPNKLTRFWQELKRRRVIHVITVYASASFVIIELITNLAEPLNLPPNLATIIIIVLAAIFPVIITLSWFYDLTGKGIEKTRPIEEIPQEQATRVPNAWKIATYISFVVIIGLVTFNIVGGSRLLRAGNTQTIMILPIDNYTGDDQLDDFISGMHSVLISDVGRISKLIVKSKITSDAYADKSLSQIAEEQGVDIVLLPDVMCLGDSICFRMEMFTSKGKELWIADYREPASQLLNLNNRITREIAEEFQIRLTENSEQILSEERTADPDALKAYMRGVARWESLEVRLAIEYFEEAMDIDPDWALPYAGLSKLWATLVFFGAVPDSIAFPNIYSNLNKTLELDPNSAETQYIVGTTATWTEMNWEKGEEAYIRALELNPSHAECHLYYAHLLMILRRNDEAVTQARIGLELDPRNQLIQGLYGIVMMHAGDYESAAAHFEEALSIDPNFGMAKGNLQYTYLTSGKYEKWLPMWKEGVCWDDHIVTAFENVLHQEGFAPAVEELLMLNEEFGTESCHMGDFNKFQWYLLLNENDKALDYLEKLYEADFSQIHYVSTNTFGYEQLKSYPRYVEILRKLKLPLPEKEN